ncbi:MAG: hypothetical protein IPK07_12785 [Deltaproteobacteria bacterium]|nr:hypothetical protein [Deltaproteobacteria bacterium]
MHRAPRLAVFSWSSAGRTDVAHGAREERLEEVGAGAHEGVGYLAVIGFGVAQYVCVYRLSRALGEPRPWMRLGSMVLPFAALSVVFAIHSKALRRLRHG